MLSDLLLPLFLRVCIAVGFVWVAKTARGRKDLQRRLQNVIPTAGAPRLEREVAVQLRMRQSTGSHLDTIARLLNVPLDVPLAHVVAPIVVFGFGIGGAVFGTWVCHFLLSFLMSVVAGLASGVFLVRGIFNWEIGRYQSKLINQLPDAVQLVVSATRAGLPVLEAFRAIAEEMPSPTHEEFTRVVSEMGLGTTADAALLSMYQRTGVTEYAIFAVTIGVQSRSGGRLAETIHNLAEIVRERLVITARANALAGEAKLSGIIMAILPLVSGVLQFFTNRDQIALLFTDPRGNKLLAIGIVTLLMGALTMRQLIKGATKD
jgi:tight adherence protein B